MNKLANGIEGLSFHEAKCTPKWDSILNDKSLRQNTSRSFISAIMRKAERQQQEAELLRQKLGSRSPFRPMG